jgi:hypothetical protein
MVLISRILFWSRAGAKPVGGDGATLILRKQWAQVFRSRAAREAKIGKLPQL